MSGRGGWVLHQMGKKKKLSEDVMQTPLKRCLNTFDITLLGIGHMVGAGIYVLTGTVARDMTGPAIIVSFLIAGFASLLAALCYAEFGARVPKAGSAYVYTYVTIGEFWAFVIGWNIILEHMIGAASVSRAWSGYIDSLFHGSISNYTSGLFGEMKVQYLASYPDPIAFLVTIAYCGLLSIGVKGSAYFNTFFTMINMCVILLVIVIGFFKANIDNWNTAGGFAPFGISGIISGAATSFYAFVGFDSIATSGEEAINPSRSIPLATIIAMALVTLGYVLVGGALTLMVPYYSINPVASLPDAFSSINLNWAKYLVSVGALAGMTTSLFGSLFSLPRCVYAMASDGLLYSWLAKVNDKTQVPVLNMIVCGIFTAFLALIFDIEKLVEFMSIGTLMAYTIVSASIIILRYQTNHGFSSTDITSSEDVELRNQKEGCHLRTSLKFLSKWLPDKGSRIVSWAVVVFSLCCFGICFHVQFAWKYIVIMRVAWAIALCAVLVFFIIISMLVILCYEQNRHELSFKVPMVPILPLLSIFFNISLMAHLNPMTWVRFVVWMAIGLVLYFAYGLHNSKEHGDSSSYSKLLAHASHSSEVADFEKFQEEISQIAEKIATDSEDFKSESNERVIE